VKLSKDEVAALVEEFRRWLRDHRLPVTRQRDLVATALFDADGHLSAEALERRLKERGHKIGTATVYRTLDVLVEAGLARAHDFGEGIRRFEASPAQGDHGHFVCSRCGAVTEFTHERVDRMLGFLADEHGFLLQRHRVELHGLCRDCQRRDLEPLRP
jgi:Fur family transcriptional regulator, ferric uptake regulator